MGHNTERRSTGSIVCGEVKETCYQDNDDLEVAGWMYRDMFGWTL